MTACAAGLLQREFASQHDFGFIYLPSFAHSYSVTNSTEDKRQALAAAEVRCTLQAGCLICMYKQQHSSWTERRASRPLHAKLHTNATLCMYMHA
jgi:hypothetical protein